MQDYDVILVAVGEFAHVDLYTNDGRYSFPTQGELPRGLCPQVDVALEQDSRNISPYPTAALRSPW
jgi:hypothetical protein